MVTCGVGSNIRCACLMAGCFKEGPRGVGRGLRDELTVRGGVVEGGCPAGSLNVGCRKDAQAIARAGARVKSAETTWKGGGGRTEAR